MISKEDLYNNQYDYETLKTNIYAVSLFDILKTQKLNAEFCVKYILNENFQLSEEDQNITLDMVLIYQPHIKNIDMINALMIATSRKMKGERIDSVEDFESYMNRNS